MKTSQCQCLRWAKAKFLPRNEGGFVLIVGLMFLGILTLLGATAFVVTSTDTKIGGNFKTSQEMFQAALAGTEHGREILRALNADSPDPASFNDELLNASGGPDGNNTFELDAADSDDVPLIGPTAIGNASYVVYLSNDAVDGNSIADSNNRVLLTSIATGPNGSRAVVETTVSLPPPPAASSSPTIPPPVATVGLLGSDANFTGGNSNAKALNGNDMCGDESPLPVVTVNNSGSVSGIQDAINSSKPKTYKTKLADGTEVDASTHMNDIARAMTADEMNSNGYDLNNPASLNALVNSIADTAGTAVGSSSDTVDLGTVEDPKIVVVDGDFTITEGNSVGAGMLVVRGDLTFNGNTNYTGIIMVIGNGRMIRNGGGNGTISGAVWVANTLNDELGVAEFDTSGGGASNVQYCSSAVNNALATLAEVEPPAPTYDPLLVSSFRHVY